MSRLQLDVRDRATSIAKHWCHDTVDDRHVFLAIAAELSLSVPDGADEVLVPRGESVAPPTFDEQAESAVEQCSSRDGAIAVFTDLAGKLDIVVDETKVDTVAVSESLETSSERSAIAELASSQRDVEDVLADLHSLTGLESVKAAIEQLVHLHRLNVEREHHSLPTMQAGLNLVFTGSPGTGKTTVARLVAELYKALGLLHSGHLVEVHRADLVAGYVGQTAIQVDRVVKRALGGVLFIDEAYALASASDHDYGSEAVSTLAKLMEDHRAELSVIVAGYSEPMERFIRSNVGLESRFQQFIQFPDYSTDELQEIFLQLAQQYELDIPEETLNRVRHAIDHAPVRTRAGNARFIRNLLQQSYGRMAARADADGIVEEHEIHVLEPVDIPRLNSELPDSFGVYL